MNMKEHEKKVIKRQDQLLLIDCWRVAGEHIILNIYAAEGLDPIGYKLEILKTERIPVKRITVSRLSKEWQALQNRVNNGLYDNLIQKYKDSAQ